MQFGPEAKAKESMNEINTAQQLCVAATDRGEAARVAGHLCGFR